MSTTTPIIEAIQPWSREAEQSVLGSMLIDPRVFDRAQPLKPEHFFDSAHATIWRTIEAMHAKRVDIDTVTVFEALRMKGRDEEVGGLVYLNALAQSVPSAHNVGNYARIVRDKAARRSLLSAADTAMEIASAPGGDMASKLDQITTLFGQIQRSGMSKVPVTLGSVAIARSQFYDDLESGKIEPGWPTRIPTLDRMLSGGLRPGAMYVLAARPSVGKSSFAQQIGLNVGQAGRRVLFLSQEMPVSDLADRAIANKARINYGDMLTGKLRPEDWSRMTDAIEELVGNDVIHVDDQSALTLADVRAKAKQVPDLKVLIVDYLQLMDGSAGRDANRNTEIEQISRGLKALAMELGVAVIALSQLSRKVTERADKRPMLSDLRDSGAIEQDADVVLMLWTHEEMDGGNRLVGLGVEKNRQGRCGEVALHFAGEHQRWGESDQPLKRQEPARPRRFEP